MRVLQIECGVVNEATSDPLWEEIETAAAGLAATVKIEQVKDIPGIKATREAYKALGKEPNRYRPAAEALCRRIINGKGLYRLTTLVDLINLISIGSGYSIGGFDADRIEGTLLILGAGKSGEQYHGIGRGLLNIEHLPVYRDSTGGIGTPTSDEERTKLTEATRRHLMIVNMYDNPEESEIEKLRERIEAALIKYASATDIRSRVI